ncbi:hypothetical protein L798_11489 [Zootermopsis nevadensis]|uniref:Uncharacterized protein n=1 Tax=Zootermopsis nevadensis TaxID=136037 RepID=A0A067R698_ZOONE|nr:hypothetical protein L798_11489 [Zootermopsis nevadensis]
MSSVNGRLEDVKRIIRQSSCEGDSKDHVLRYRQEAELRDTRAIPIRDHGTKVDNSTNLNELQREKPFNLLLKYEKSFNTRPGKCKNFSYKFDVSCPGPLVGYSRPIPFSVRNEVRAQMEQMKKDGILEISTSTHLNPFINCDARKVNRFMTADRARVQPINELLQQFHRARFISTRITCIHSFSVRIPGLPVY